MSSLTPGGTRTPGWIPLVCSNSGHELWLAGAHREFSIAGGGADTEATQFKFHFKNHVIKIMSQV
jgi:hypothetical protein